MPYHVSRDATPDYHPQYSIVDLATGRTIATIHPTGEDEREETLAIANRMAAVDDLLEALRQSTFAMADAVKRCGGEQARAIMVQICANQSAIAAAENG